MSDTEKARVARGEHPPRQQPDYLAIGLTVLAVVLLLVVGTRQVGPYVAAWFSNRLHDSEELVLKHDLGPILVAYFGDAAERPDSIRISHKFVIRNPSRDQALILTRQSKSCGCLHVADPPPIEPNAQGTVEVAFLASTGSSVRREQVTYETNLPRPKRIILVLGAQTLPECELPIDRRLYIPYDGPYKVTTSVYYHSNSKQSPARALLGWDNQHVEATWAGSWRRVYVGNGIYRHSRPVEINIPSKGQTVLVTGGAIYGSLQVQLGDKMYRFALEFTSNPPVRLSPPQVFLAEEPQTLEIRADTPFRIGQPYDTLSMLKCRWKDCVGDSTQRVELTVVAPPKEPLVETVLHIPVDGLPVPEIAVPVYVFGPTSAESQ